MSIANVVIVNISGTKEDIKAYKNWFKKSIEFDLLTNGRLSMDYDKKHLFTPNNEDDEDEYCGDYWSLFDGQFETDEKEEIEFWLVYSVGEEAPEKLTDMLMDKFSAISEKIEYNCPSLEINVEWETDSQDYYEAVNQ